MATPISEPLLNDFVVGVFYDSPGIPNATSATAGAPGTFQPSGCDVPANLAGMAGVTAIPATAWTTGQYVATRTADVHWTGTAWAAGRTLEAQQAPPPPEPEPAAPAEPDPGTG